MSSVKFIKFELNRVTSRLNVFIFLFFIIISVLLLYTRIVEFRIFESEILNFQKREQSKIQGYNNYDQYGAFGVRILLKPSILSIYSNNQSQRITSNIDTKEIINVNKNDRGKDAFKKPTNGFHSTYYMFGCLLILLFGWETLKSKTLIDFFKSQNRLFFIIFFRAIIVLIIILALDFLMILIPIFSGVKISFFELKMYGYLSLAHTIIALLYYFFGFFARKLPILKSSFLTCLMLWGCLSIGIPHLINLYIEYQSNRIEDIEVINKIKESRVMKFESESQKKMKFFSPKNRNEVLKAMKKLAIEFLEDTHYENNTIDRTVRNQELNLIKTKEKIKSFFPNSFLNAISLEISGIGDRGRDAFLDYIMNLREKFLLFYIKKNFVDDQKKVKSFLRKNENVYFAKPVLIESYFLGLVFHIVFLVITILGLILIFKKNKKLAEISDLSMSNYPNEQLYFIFCPDNLTNRVVEYYRLKKGVLFIHNFKKEDFNEFSDIKKLFEYACFCYSSERKTAESNLMTLGLDINYSKNMCFSDENVLKVFISAAFATKDNTIFLKMILKGHSALFENQLLNLIENYLGLKRVIYLDSKMYQTTSFIESRAKDMKVIPIDSMEVSFR